MAVRGDQRGVAPVVGFVLIFGFLAISFAVYQGIIVPEQNRVAEFEHNQQVQEQLQTLRNAIRNAATAGTEESVAVRLDATYPRRTIARNLGIATGRIESVPLGAGIRIENVTATDAETADYFGGTNTTIGPLESRALVYTPFYTRYDNSPETMYENTVAYNQFAEENITVTDQTIVDGREITLIALSGNLSEAGRGTVSVDVESLSTASRAVAITNDSGPLNLTIPTQLAATDWSTLLAGEMDGPGADEQYVTDVRQTGPDQVSILLEPGVTYNLRLAKVGVGEGATAEPARYVTDVEGDGTSVVENGIQRLVVEVRDRFNNPVSNVTVEAELTSGPGGDVVSPADVTTDTTGRASFTYQAPVDVNGTQNAKVTAFYGAKTPENQSVVFNLTVLDTDGSGSNGSSGGVEDVNPVGTGTVSVTSVSSVGGGGTPDVTVTLKNETGAAGTVEISQARIGFFFKGGQRPEPTFAELNATNISTPTTLDIGADFAVLNERISLAPDTTILDLAFDERVEHEDFYVLSFVIEFPSGDVVTYNYFISHPS